MKALRGVTLIEMMIVVGIVGIVASIAVPNMGPLVKRQRLKGKAEEVASLIDRGRRLAMGTGRCHAIALSGTDLVLQERTDALRANCVLGAPLSMASATWGTVQRVVTDTSQISFVIEASETPIVLRPNGRLRGNGNHDTNDERARVRIHHAAINEGYIVKIMPHGRLCKTNYLTTVPAVATPEDCG